MEAPYKSEALRFPQRRRRGIPRKEGAAVFKKVAAIIVFSLSVTGLVSAHKRESLVAFDGGIGVIPASSVAGTANPDGTFPNVNRNIVRGVNPPGAPWRIADLKADVDIYGRIKVRGRGLLLAGGNSIGQNANLKVIATLICEAALPFVERSTSLAGVPLEPNGDFRIDDTLSPAPSACASPVLLIRSTGGTWLAAGIVKSDDDDN